MVDPIIGYTDRFRHTLRGGSIASKREVSVPSRPHGHVSRSFSPSPFILLTFSFLYNGCHCGAVHAAVCMPRSFPAVSTDKNLKEKAKRRRHRNNAGPYWLWKFHGLRRHGVGEGDRNKRHTAQRRTHTRTRKMRVYRKKNTKRSRKVYEDSSDDELEHGVSWDQKQWNVWIEELLVFVNEVNPTDERLFSTERHLLPGLRDSVRRVTERITEDMSSPFCYLYKGKFLPAAKADGLYWKPSQGATPTGRNLLKRYFYTNTPWGLRVRRQVTWLNGSDDWTFIDYRSSTDVKTTLDRLRGPEDFDWHELVKRVAEHKIHKAEARKMRRTGRRKIIPKLEETSSEEEPILDETASENEQTSPLSSQEEHRDGDRATDALNDFKPDLGMIIVKEEDGSLYTEMFGAPPLSPICEDENVIESLQSFLMRSAESLSPLSETCGSGSDDEPSYPCWFDMDFLARANAELERTQIVPFMDHQEHSRPEAGPNERSRLHPPQKSNVPAQGNQRRKNRPAYDLEKEREANRQRRLKQATFNASSDPIVPNRTLSRETANTVTPAISGLSTSIPSTMKKKQGVVQHPKQLSELQRNRLNEEYMKEGREDISLSLKKVLSVELDLPMKRINGWLLSKRRVKSRTQEKKKREERRPTPLDIEGRREEEEETEIIEDEEEEERREEERREQERRGKVRREEERRLEERREQKREENKRGERKREESKRGENKRGERKREESKREENKREENKRDEKKRKENKREENKREEKKRGESKREENKRKERKRKEKKREESKREESKREKNKREENKRGGAKEARKRSEEEKLREQLKRRREVRRNTIKEREAQARADEEEKKREEERDKREEEKASEERGERQKTSEERGEREEKRARAVERLIMVTEIVGQQANMMKLTSGGDREEMMLQLEIQKRIVQQIQGQNDGMDRHYHDEEAFDEGEYMLERIANRVIQKMKAAETNSASSGETLEVALEMTEGKHQSNPELQQTNSGKSIS
ncbi:hypothetical protein PROFUN_15941 [Planoprotostelium fungivorum]|uniref:Uncharacterized protein n=1 Tax=Planoprotostelium fungivorum TaxID=1890364 RepID=A0A2P6MU42_9EUKA|nr:hypothetical protein PROFUN_15941 [Planoprotostelium fungivorum]